MVDRRNRETHLESICRSCGAPIIFAITSKGRRMPLDAPPDPAGEWTVTEFGDLERVDTGTPAEQRFTSHFATCPHAK